MAASICQPESLERGGEWRGGMWESVSGGDQGRPLWAFGPWEAWNAAEGPEVARM